MSTACRTFRDRLAVELSGSPQLTELSWHEHLLGCADCRALLEAEEALETLLASLPDPQLPPALTERVLARLVGARDDTALDALLALDQVEHAPGDLAGDVLAALRPHRSAAAARNETALDRLLDRVPAPELPVGLATRTLTALDRHRGRSRPQRVATRLSLFAAAAALLMAFGYVTWVASARWPTSQPDGSPEDLALLEPREEPLAQSTTLVEPEPAETPRVVERDPRPEPARPLTPRQPVELIDEPSEELLASLDLLESWDLLTSDDLELALASLDEVDGALLELEGGI